MITKTWKQPKCPSAGEWINKWVRAHNRILFSSNKEQTTGTSASWVHLKCISRGKARIETQTQQCVIPLLQFSGKGKTTGVKTRSVITRAWC